MKKDSNLGNFIGNKLKILNIETPSVKFNTAWKNKEFTCLKIEESFIDIMSFLGLDLENDSLKDTPARIAKMFVYEIFEGLNYDNFPKCTTVDNEMQYDEMVVISDIDVSSVCEHHFQNIIGRCKIAYIPNKKILGLSKFNRVVRFFSKRPQIQERLTEQIYHALVLILGTSDIAVEIIADHYCVKARGVEDKNSITTTRKLGGVFKKDHEVRNEFLNS